MILTVASCGDDEGDARTDPTATTQTTAVDPGDLAIEDERCDPATDLIDDAGYGLVAATSDIDTGDGQGPSDEVICTFSLLVPPQDTAQTQTRTVVVAADGSAVEQKAFHPE
ncbi:MAG: hypothetical protein ABIX10_05755 [Acidimicrobiales bacterium]